jgi:ribosomal protein S18 acetylase RimI-like enzyme
VRLRAATAADAEAVLAVIVARDVADLGRPDFTLDDLRDEWNATGFDLETDAVVAELNGYRIAGYAGIRRAGALVTVAPEAEGQGIGAHLLEWVERRERELGRTHHRQWVGSRNGQARDLLTSGGYACVRSHYRMVRALGDPDRIAAPPLAAVLRRPDFVADAEALHVLDVASFSSAPDYLPSSAGVFREEHLCAHDADAGLSNVAVEDGAMVGFLLTRRLADEDAGFIDLLMVHPDHQGRGLGTALLLTAFREYAAAGLGEAQLGVASDNPIALRLYERHGMRPRFRVDTYERPVARRLV